MSEIDKIQKWIIAKISFKEVIIKLIDMPTSIAGFCYKSSKGRFYILINVRHSPQTQYKTLWHEIKHVYDFESGKIFFYSSLEEIEKEAELFAESIIKRKVIIK